MRVLVPVNNLDRAKGRLASLLAPGDRARLFLATVNTVVGAASGSGANVTVLTADPRIPVALGPGVDVLEEDPALQGLNAQLESALERLAAREPLAEVLVLHADLPLATGESVAALIAAAPPAPSVTLVRSPDGGTNAMLLRPPGRFPLAYGRDSFAHHESAARAAGMAVRAVDLPPLALDLDTPADVDALLRTPGGPGTAAGRLLASLGLASSA